jgi:hypothetical protein
MVHSSFLVYADYVNILAGSIHTIRRNIEALVVASIETGLVVNADKTEHMVMSRYQNAGQSRNIKTEVVPLKEWNSSNVWEIP